MRLRSRKIFPEFDYIEDTSHNDTPLYKYTSPSIRIEISTVVRFKFRKVWYETECVQSHMLEHEHLQHKERIIVDLISKLVKDAYHYQQIGAIAPGTMPSKLQISEKERLNLKELLKYNNLNNLI